MIVGKVGDKAYLDGIEGLVPCTVLAITPTKVRVKMRAKDGVQSWHGMARYPNDWDTEEEFTHHMVVPERALVGTAASEFHNRILPYKWEQS